MNLHDAGAPLPAALRYGEREHSRVVMQRILVIIDSADTMYACIEKATRIASSCGSAIELMVRDFEIELPGSWAGGHRTKELRMALRKRREEELEAAAETLKQRGLNVTVTTEWTLEHSERLAEWVVRSKPDLVVCGRRVHGAKPGLPKPADLKLLHETAAPLLLVSGLAWRDHPVIVAAVDPCHPAERPVLLEQDIFAKACSLAASLAGQIVLLHVLERVPHLRGEPVSPELQAQADAKARREVEALVRPQCRSLAEIRFEEGPVPATIADMVQSRAPDILVIGFAARQRQSHSGANATAPKVLEQVSCDVLIVKPPGFVSPLLVTDS